MEGIHRIDDVRMNEFYQAAWRGDAEALNQLLQRDGTTSLSNNIPVRSQTPLHVSAMLGHVPFTVILLNHDGDNITGREDFCGRTALHVASAEGHIDIVKELLRVNNEPCLGRDKEGRIPLYYAAMRGRTEVVQELIMARPDSLSLVDGEETTVFHLCVTYNHLETLDTLIKLDYATANIAGGQPRPPIFTCPDRDGDTILHLAIMLKRAEVVSYLLSIPEIKETANMKNRIGFTADDILRQSPKDFKICEIKRMLSKAEKKGLETGGDGCCIKMFKCILMYPCVKSLQNWWKEEDTWLWEIRENLSLVSTVIATITFQALINPPGGFIQQGLPSPSPSSIGNTNSSNQVLNNNVTSSNDDPLSCTTILPYNHTYCPGQASASSSYLVGRFERYLFYVTISFFSSLSVTLLIVSGIFPMNNRAVIWILSVGIYFSLTSLAAAYVTAIDIIAPYHVLQNKLIYNMKHAAMYSVWRALLMIIASLFSFRFYLWMSVKSSSWGRGINGCGRFLSWLLRMTAYSMVLFASMFAVFSLFDFYGLLMYLDS